jgi:6-pyruvoyltetrahydropterin/6-carboxytetrahydropterin synthase
LLEFLDNKVMQTITKSYRDLPAAHRQPNHDGHCRLVHGHNWGFDITIACDTLDENGFVLDVGKMKVVKARLEQLFDHTLLINYEDPLLSQFKTMDREGLVELVLVPNCGMEGLAKFVCHDIQKILEDTFGTDRGLQVIEVVCLEDSKNIATYKYLVQP